MQSRLNNFEKVRELMKQQKFMKQQKSIITPHYVSDQAGRVPNIPIHK